MSILNAAEQRGLRAFIKLDCKSYHDGKLPGGETDEPLGKEHPFPDCTALAVEYSAGCIFIPEEIGGFIFTLGVVSAESASA